MNRTLPALLAIAVLLSACGKTETTTPAASAPVAADVADLAAKAQVKAAAASLPQADAATPASSYVDITSGHQLMYSYLALSGVPPDYAAVAQRISREYAGSNDAFRKQEVLDALKPQIDAKVNEAKTRRYLRYQINGQGALSPYAMDKAAFPAKFADAGTYYYMYDNGDYKLAFTNGDGYSLLKADQEAGRKIEAARSCYKDFAIVVYAYAQEADLASNQVKAQIVKVAIKLNGEEIPVNQAR